MQSEECLLETIPDDERSALRVELRAQRLEGRQVVLGERRDESGKPITRNEAVALRR